jgi:hypothetical protein
MSSIYAVQFLWNWQKGPVATYSNKYVEFGLEQYKK